MPCLLRESDVIWVCCEFYLPAPNIQCHCTFVILPSESLSTMSERVSLSSFMHTGMMLFYAVQRVLRVTFPLFGWCILMSVCAIASQFRENCALHFLSAGTASHLCSATCVTRCRLHAKRTCTAVKFDSVIGRWKARTESIERNCISYDSTCELISKLG